MGFLRETRGFGSGFCIGRNAASRFGGDAVCGVSLEFEDGVRDGGPDGCEVFDGPGGGAGEVDDESAVTDAGNGAGEHGVGRFGEAGGAHGFGEAGDEAVEHLLRGFGGDVAGRESGASGGEDEVDGSGVCPVAEGGGDLRLLVGDDGGGDFDGAGGEKGGEGGAAEIGAVPGGTLVTDGEDGGSHGDHCDTHFEAR